VFGHEKEIYRLTNQSSLHAGCFIDGRRKRDMNKVREFVGDIWILDIFVVHFLNWSDWGILERERLRCQTQKILSMTLKL